MREERDGATPTKCSICGTSLLDKPRINDMCQTCDHAVHPQQSPNWDWSQLDTDGEDWKE